MFDGLHTMVTMISPSPQKGLSILLPLAERFKQYKFMVVATTWTDEHVLKHLQECGILVIKATPNLDKLYGATRVLLAPSLWPEVYGLVVVEAALRGVPCISSGSGGLPEANMVPDLVVETPLYYCCDKRHFKDFSMREVEDRAWQGREHGDEWQAANTVEKRPFWQKINTEKYRELVTHRAREDVVEPYARLLQRLMEDPEYLQWASDAAYNGARKHVLAEQHSFADFLSKG